MRRRPNWKREKLVWTSGGLLCGVDEVGTGAWAGPVYAGAVIFPSYIRVPKLMDSKLLRSKEREVGALFLMEHTIWAVGRAEVHEVSALGLRPATLLAMRRAIDGLATPPTHVVVDAWTLPNLPYPQEAVIRGDYEVASVAAASIVAKFHRDQAMKVLDFEFPGYGFGDHKGYGTKRHQAALRLLGPCDCHRMTYQPIARLSQKTGF